MTVKTTRVQSAVFPGRFCPPHGPHLQGDRLVRPVTYTDPLCSLFSLSLSLFLFRKIKKNTAINRAGKRE